MTLCETQPCITRHARPMSPDLLANELSVVLRYRLTDLSTSPSFSVLPSAFFKADEILLLPFPRRGPCLAFLSLSSGGSMPRLLSSAVPDEFAPLWRSRSLEQAFSLFFYFSLLSTIFSVSKFYLPLPFV